MIEWFERETGSDVGIGGDENVGMILVGATPGVGDPIKVPDHPGFPGGMRRITAVITAPCVGKGHDHDATHYVLDGPIFCCECVSSGQYFWYKRS